MGDVEEGQIKIRVRVSCISRESQFKAGLSLRYYPKKTCHKESGTRHNCAANDSILELANHLLPLSAAARADMLLHQRQMAML